MSTPSFTVRGPSRSGERVRAEALDWAFAELQRAGATEPDRVRFCRVDPSCEGGSHRERTVSYRHRNWSADCDIRLASAAQRKRLRRIGEHQCPRWTIAEDLDVARIADASDAVQKRRFWRSIRGAHLKASGTRTGRSLVKSSGPALPNGAVVLTLNADCAAPSSEASTGVADDSPRKMVVNCGKAALTS